MRELTICGRKGEVDMRKGRGIGSKMGLERRGEKRGKVRKMRRG
jgi:hypothetical protein